MQRPPLSKDNLKYSPFKSNQNIYSQEFNNNLMK
jgi:hypothetical protein